MIRYSEQHEYAKKEGTIYYIGISEYAQSELGDIVYVELPGEGTEIAAGDVFGSVESVKAVSELYAPVGGKIVKVNEKLDGNPELLNENALENWIIAVESDSEEDFNKLMDEERI